MKRIKLKSGDEYDAFSKFRNMMKWKRGELKKVKRRYNKRFRKYEKINL